MARTAQEMDQRLPRPCGPSSEWVLDRIGSGVRRPAPTVADDGFCRDVQLALYLSYEMHYATAPATDVDEWDPVLIEFRRRLEQVLEAALVGHVGVPPHDLVGVDAAITALVAAHDGPSLSEYMERRGTMAQMRQVAKHRSLYQLKEGDGHTFGIPGVRGRTQQLLVRIQCGEYGADAEDRSPHSALYARSMRSLGLDAVPNAYLDEVPASAMMVSNLVSLFGLHRRWSAALVGHLTAFELTSVAPMARYARALRRLGADEEALRFYDVHVLADVEHELLALEMSNSLAAAEPEHTGDILFGAACALAVERLFAEDLLESWNAPVDTAA